MIAARFTTRYLPALLAVLAVVVCSGAATAPADAATQPWWQLTAITAPAHLVPGEEGQIHATVTNIGDANAIVAGEPLTITDNLPAGLEAVENGSKGYEGPLLSPETPDYKAGAVTCATHPSTVTCTYTSTVPLAPFVPIEVAINVKVGSDGAANGAVNELTAAGAGVPPVTVRRPLKVDSSGTAYGIEDYELIAENEGGSADTQAGSHPFQLTTTLGINNLFIENPSKTLRATFPKIAFATALSKDLVVTLPPGLVGNATTLPKCTEAQFTTEIGYVNTCPANSAVGVASATLFEPEAPSFGPNGGGVATAEIPVFNLPPAKGEPARFGFDAYDTFVTLDTSVRTGEDYAVVTDVRNVSEIAPLLASSVTLWGVPGDSRHNEVRGWECLESAIGENSQCSAAQAPPESPFLTLPGSCTEPLSSSLVADSWKEPGNRLPGGSIEESDPRWKQAPAPEHASPTLSGCSQLPFTPSINAQPETQAGSTPTGLSVDVHLPQPETANSLSEADVKDTTVTLPQGVELNPAASHGLEACTEEEVGYLGQATFSGEPTSHFTPTLPQQSCPSGSKVATVKVKTPLLEHELEGSVYLAEPAPNGEAGKNPFNSLVALYIIAEDPFSGVLVKLAGEVSVNEQTGQATTTFKSTPQTPFEDLKMNFFSGPTATLTTPAYCGTYTTTASFTPWSGTPAVEEGSSFPITSHCTQPGTNQPFGPSLQAGSSSNQAGAFAPFTVSIGNPDGNQPLKNLTMHLPPGVAAMISSVTPCPAAQAFPGNRGAPHCGAESIVGHSVAFSGLGGDPYELPGTVYLTGPYEGAPFGLAVSTHAKAGPFDLGYIVIGSTINVDENTAAVTVTSDPFPQYVRGIPSALKQIVVTVERPGNAPFQFNPTNCSPMAITGSLTGVQGGAQGFNQPFQVTPASCAKLPFKPTLTASTKGNASKANGAEFVVRVTSTPGQANIAKTKLQLPLQLPSRLTTIQKACPDTVFEKNPAGCDEGSNIGIAIVHTPVFKNPLTGPAYLVSHGNAAFPDVEFVLQGEGVTLILDGQTDIKKGITTSTFNSVPDAPVTTFETILPEGPHSALTSNVPTSKAFSLCGQNLVMPTVITGQNGVVINQQTKIPVAGCAAVKGFKESRATKLAKALKKCRKQFKHSKKKRASCEAKARKKFGAKKKKSKKKGAKKKK